MGSIGIETMIDDRIYSYFKDYLQQCLGVRELLLSEIEDVGVEKAITTRFDLHWEGLEDIDASKSFLVLFVRIPSHLSSWPPATSSTEVLSEVSSTIEPASMNEALLLKNQPKALELFQKLRQALRLDSTVAPFVEVLSGESEAALAFLRTKAQHIFIMTGSQIEKCESHESKSEWIIPDPVILEQSPALKRPTWELLKTWLEV